MKNIVFLIILLFIEQKASQSTESFFKTEYVALQDGIKLAVDIYKPDDQKSLPVIFVFTPYGRGRQLSSEANKWYQYRYRLVLADVRGTGDSEGEFEFLINDGKDGAYLVEWIARQHWCNKRVAMRGASYFGTNQWYVAIQQPPSLKCINPSSSILNPLGQAIYRDGAFALGFNLLIKLYFKSNYDSPFNLTNSDFSSWLKYRPLRELDVFATGKEQRLYRKLLDLKLTDPFWRLYEISDNQYAQLNIPTLSFAGWYDHTLYGTIHHFEKVRTLSKAKKDQFLVVGPYGHFSAYNGGLNSVTGEPIKNVGDYVFEDTAFVPGFEMTREFYDWCLKNETRPKWLQSRIYVVNSNYWIESDKFSPYNLKSSFLYLNKNGKLDWREPTCVNNDFYVYNPNDPLIMISHNFDDPVDMSLHLNRSDFLVFTSDAIKEPFTVIGEVVVELTVSSSAKDTDFMAFLMDVNKENRSIKIGSMPISLVRMRYRNGFANESLLKPNERYNVKINMREISHTFIPGHRIRLAITSSFFPYISANPNTGNPISTDISEPVRALQKIYFGSPFKGIFSRIHFKQLS